MKNRTITLFVLGVVLETAGFFGQHVEDIPFIMAVLVPEQSGVADGIAHLTNSSTLPGQRGFESITTLFSRSRQTNLEALATPRVTKIAVLSSTKASISGRVFENINLQFQLANGQYVGWDTNGIRAELERLKNSRLFRFGAGVFAAGVLVQCIGFCLEKRRTRPVLSLRSRNIWMLVGAALLVALILSLLVAFGKIQTSTAWANLASNIAAEIVGIVLIVLVVDRILEYRKELERRRIEQAALRELRYPLKRCLELVKRLHQHASTEPSVFDSYEKLLTPETARKIASLDLTTLPSFAFYANTHRGRPFIESFFDVQRSLVNAAKEISSRYISHMSLPLFRALEEMAWAVILAGNTIGEDQAQRHVESLRRLVEIYNHLSESPILPRG